MTNLSLQDMFDTSVNRNFVVQKISDEQKKKMSKSHMGRKKTAETKAKMSVAAKLRFAKSVHNRKGASQTLEAKTKMSKAKSGKPMSEAAKQAMRDGWARKKAEGYKRVVSAETRLKISAAWAKRKANIKHK